MERGVICKIFQIYIFQHSFISDNHKIPPKAEQHFSSHNSTKYQTSIMYVLIPIIGFFNVKISVSRPNEWIKDLRHKDKFIHSGFQLHVFIYLLLVSKINFKTLIYQNKRDYLLPLHLSI